MAKTRATSRSLKAALKAAVPGTTAPTAEAANAEEFVNVRIPRKLYDDLRNPPTPKEADAAKVIQAAEAATIALRLWGSLDLIWTMHKMAARPVDDAEEGETLATVVRRFTTDAGRIIDDAREALGSIRVGYFDQEEPASEMVQEEIQP